MKNQAIIDRMTLAQKCALLSGRDVWSTRPVQSAGVPSIVLSDGPSGLRRQLGEGDHLGLNESEKATCFPSASTVANSWDTELAEKIGAALGDEACALGVDVVLGPGLNTKRSPLCGRNFEYFAEDPYLAGKMAAGYIRGIQSRGVSACPKHFAANSQELHRMASNSVVDERTLRELYLTNFEIAVREGKPRTIMTSYNEVNGTYANENAHLLRDILRGEWGFDGMVVTDWGGSNDFVEGVRAGSNLEMPGTGDDSACQLYKAVKSGAIEEAVVDQRVDELLDVILWAAKREKKAADLPHNHAVAREAAERSIVLLKNEESILPLSPDTKIALIGDFADMPRYQGAGSSMVNSANLVRTLDVVRNTFANVTFARGFTRADAWDEALAQEAVAAAKDAQAVVLYMGLPEVCEAEGLERGSMRVPENQIRLLGELAKVNRRIVVAFSGGSAVEMPWLDQCMGLLWLGLGGEAGAEAALSVLSGRACPGGKLSETFVRSYGDLPVSRNYPCPERRCEYREGLFTGYRFTETVGIDVTYPLGYGLSYTTFEYGQLQADEKQVSFEITNTGARAGDEIAQVYVSLPDGGVLRPAKELKGFARVHLEPGETRRVTIALDDKAFRYFNVETNRFEIEGGAWQVLVGANVRDIRLTKTVQVTGSGAAIPESAKRSAMPRDLKHVTDAEFERLLGHSLEKQEKTALLGLNDPLDAAIHAKNPVARFVVRRLLAIRSRSIAAGKPDLNILFITNIPFRGMAKMMNGMLTMSMARSLLDLVNNRWGKGLGGLIGGFFRKPSLKRLEEESK